MIIMDLVSSICLQVKSERDVLARQSQLLMMDAASDEKIMKLLFEVEQLQRTLNEERQQHAEQLKDLQVSNGIGHNIYYCFIQMYFAGKN